VSAGVPVIRGNNLTTDATKFADDGFVFVTPEKADELGNCDALPGDLVFTAAGTLGQVGSGRGRRRSEGQGEDAQGRERDTGQTGLERAIGHTQALPSAAG